MTSCFNILKANVSALKMFRYLINIYHQGFQGIYAFTHHSKSRSNTLSVLKTGMEAINYCKVFAQINCISLQDQADQLGTDLHGIVYQQ